MARDLRLSVEFPHYGRKDGKDPGFGEELSRAIGFPLKFHEIIYFGLHGIVWFKVAL